MLTSVNLNFPSGVKGPKTQRGRTLRPFLHPRSTSGEEGRLGAGREFEPSAANAAVTGITGGTLSYVQCNRSVIVQGRRLERLSLNFALRVKGHKTQR